LENSEEIRNNSYLDLVKKNKLSELQEAVLKFLFIFGPATDHQISEKLNIPLASVNGRRNELVDLGLVAQVGIDYSNEKPRTLWKFLEIGEQSTQKLESNCLTFSELAKVEKLIQRMNLHQIQRIKSVLETQFELINLKNKQAVKYYDTWLIEGTQDYDLYMKGNL